MSNLQIMHAVLGPVQTNCYIVSSEGNTNVFLVDPGDEAERLIQFLDNEKLSVEAILLTHGHFDHIGAVDDLKKRYPEAVVYIGKNDADMLSDAGLNASFSLMGCGMSARFDKVLRDQEKLSLLGVEITVIETPGHTAGGVCYYIPEEKLLFSGDTLFAGSVGRSDLPTGSEAALIRSCKEKLLVLPDDTNVLPGHGSATTIAYEKEYNMFLG